MVRKTLCQIQFLTLEFWSESDKEITRNRNVNLSTTQISTLSLTNDPENEGKVFLFRYGKKIFDKLMAMQPEFEDETPTNPFDFWEGANFKLKIQSRWILEL